MPIPPITASSTEPSILPLSSSPATATRVSRPGTREKWPRASRLAPVQEFPKEGHDSWVPSGKVGEGVSLYFICEDVIAIYQELKSRGIQASEPQVGNAMWVTGLSDPDGYRLFFESATDKPEETKLSGLKR